MKLVQRLKNEVVSLKMNSIQRIKNVVSLKMKSIQRNEKRSSLKLESTEKKKLDGVEDEIDPTTDMNNSTLKSGVSIQRICVTSSLEMCFSGTNVG